MISYLTKSRIQRACVENETIPAKEIKAFLEIVKTAKINEAELERMHHLSQCLHYSCIDAGIPTPTAMDVVEITTYIAKNWDKLRVHNYIYRVLYDIATICNI
ncbi:hypothetical protein SAMN02910358_01748 [Lachnospiraceae bacterium XBB1006]|nr:hypothetical protein SAMN02910358_01748 [Lachnospiraceae bacterium XBB1006]